MDKDKRSVKVMRKHILIAAMVIITGMAVTGCGSKQETSASAGELTRETSIEETTKVAKKIEKQTELKTKETETTKGKEASEPTEATTSKVGEATVEKTTNPQEPTTIPAKSQSEAPTQVQIHQPQPEVPTPAPEPVTEAPTPAPESPTEAPTQAPQPQPEVPTPASEPVTEAPTQPQKTQAEYLEEFKQNYSKLRKSLYGDTAAGNPQWSEKLYQIAKLRADELDSYFDHYSPNGYRNGYNTLECITQWHGYAGAWDGWCQSSDHYEILCNQRMDMYAVAVGKGGCVFLTASSKDWNGEAFADEQIEEAKRDLKEIAINDYGANESNWKQILEEQFLWQITDKDGNYQFGLKYEQYLKDEWNIQYDWYTQHYGEKVIK